MDMYLGIPSVVLDPDKKRRKLYGKAGAFRLQPWGVEYRVLSSGMMSDEKLLKFIWSGILKTIEANNNGRARFPGDMVTKVINNSDVEGARDLIARGNLVDAEFVDLFQEPKKEKK